jgi:hypothetical protein
MEGNEHDTDRRSTAVTGVALLESLMATARGSVPLGEATDEDWTAKRALDAADPARNLAATDHFLAELRPYCVTATTTTREALAQYFAQRPGDRQAALFGLAT